MKHRASIILAAPLLALGGATAAAQPTAPESVLISAAALPGVVLDPDKIPVKSETLTAADLSRFGPSSALGALNNSSSVSFADAQANPFQPNLTYRGFEASPLAGNAQGLAVYANGVRLNQPFGDTLNWDLIPDVAIDRLTLEGSNPVFGLNALGGALAIQLKNGFSYSGAEAEGAAGSFGRVQGAFQYGVADGNQALYVAGQGLTETGWRDHSPSKLGQLFADLGWRTGGTELHLNLLGAQSDLTGNGTAPVELLAVDRAAIFTFPDRTQNAYGLANLYGTHRVNEALSLQGNVYVSHLHQRTRNGDASEAEVCGTELCTEDGDELEDENGDEIPDFLTGGPYAQLNRTATDTLGYGGAIQFSYEAPLAARQNRLLAGFAFDGGHTRFSANSQIGALGATRGYEGPGIVIDQPDGSIAPVRVDSDNAYYGLYVADMLDVTSALTLSASARLNIADIGLHDKRGTALNGSHSYARLNPALGAAYAVLPTFSLYAGYAEANRAPTPAEFSCADPAAPCSLTNFFVGDPALKQVVARTVEAGLRGTSTLLPGANVKFHLGLYRTDTENDIMFVASSIVGRAFFQNVGDTRRQGLESSLDVRGESWSLSLDYSYTEASFRSALTLNSPENPEADTNGQIQVVSGNRLPSVPAHLFKTVLAFEPLTGWTIALAGRAASGAYLRGDEANLNRKTRPYAVFDISSSYRLSERFELFATIANLFDETYETFGTFSPTADVPIAEAPGARDPRSLSPAAPRAFFGGLRIEL